MPEGPRPAVYEALAKVPGVRIPGEPDAKGRAGFGITYAAEFQGRGTGREVLVFDPTTYAYFGRESHAAQG